MKTEAEIFLEYEAALKQADSLSEAAQEIRTAVAEGTESAALSLSASWKGEGAEAFEGKCKILREKAGAISRALADTADAVRTIAGNIYHAEMKALAIAEIRDY